MVSNDGVNNRDTGIVPKLFITLIQTVDHTEMLANSVTDEEGIVPEGSVVETGSRLRQILLNRSARNGHV